MNNWLKKIHSFVLPSTCTLCAAPGMESRDICEPCYLSLPFNNSACQRCGLPLDAAAGHGVCGQCLQHPPLYQRCIAPWRYEAPVDYFIQRLKFNKDLVYARLMAGLFAQHLMEVYENVGEIPDAIIPVPLHAARLRERGFNQSVEIAREIASQMRVALDLRSCSRPKSTLPQAELPAAQRKQNIKGAFAYQPAHRYRRIALVDDVMTTGHTISELVKTIQKSSQCLIDVWVCARANR